jgi:hypothetical protein
MEIQTVTSEDMLKHGPDIGRIRALEARILELRAEVARLKIKAGETLTIEDIQPGL